MGIIITSITIIIEIDCMIIHMIGSDNTKNKKENAR